MGWQSQGLGLAGPQAVLGASGRVPPGTPQIRGWDFDDGNDLHAVMRSMAHSGFQAAALGQGIAEVQRMVGPPDPPAPAGLRAISPALPSHAAATAFAGDIVREGIAGRGA